MARALCQVPALRLSQATQGALPLIPCVEVLRRALVKTFNHPMFYIAMSLRRQDWENLLWMINENGGGSRYGN
jgi:hypothetical protein